jgi:hypothetical protein
MKTPFWHGFWLGMYRGGLIALPIFAAFALWWYS